jgi:DNA polymerase-3 subunit delta'
MLGHEILIKNFQKLIELKRLGHAYVFFGAEGVGKFLFAKSLANYLETGIFDDPQEAILNDFYVIKPDEKGTIGVDAIRKLKYYFSEKPNRSAYRLAVINDADRLTTEAQNALLKTTEEPPATSLLIFIIKETDLLGETLVSRTHKIFFSPIKIGEIKKWLIDEKRITEKDAGEIARKSGGRPGLALAILENKYFLKNYKLAGDLIKSEGTVRKDLIKKIIEPDGFDLARFLDVLLLAIANEVKGQPIFWHQALELRRNADFFNLNPRLQLEGLFSSK